MATKLHFFAISAIGIVVIFSLGYCSGSNPNGAIHAKVTANGFNYINSVLKTVINQKINSLSIPNFSGNKNHADYRVTNVRLTRVVVGPSKITPTTAGLQWELSFDHLDMRADWWYRYKRKWFRVSDDGYFDVEFKRLRFAATLKPTTTNGKLAVFPTSALRSDCAKFDSVKVKIRGSGFAWLYNFIAGRFKGKIEAMIPPQVCSAAGRALHDWSAGIFPNMKTSDTFDIEGQEFLADYGLLDPQYGNGFTNLRFRGEVHPVPNSVSNFPFSVSPTPSTGSSKHFYLVISDFVANSLLYSAHSKGLARQSFSTGDIVKEQSVKRLLDQFCQGNPSCGSASAAFNFDVAQAPKMFFSAARGLTLDVRGAQVKVVADVAGRLNELVSVVVNATISAMPTLSSDGRRLTFTFSNVNVNVDLIRPSISQSKEQQIRSFINMAAQRYGLAALNRFGAKGIELPNIKGGKIEIKDHQLKIEDGALVLAANLLFKL